MSLAEKIQRDTKAAMKQRDRASRGRTADARRRAQER